MRIDVLIQRFFRSWSPLFRQAGHTPGWFSIVALYQLISFSLQAASWKLICDWCFCSLHYVSVGFDTTGGFDHLICLPGGDLVNFMTLGCWRILHCITFARSALTILDVIILRVSMWSQIQQRAVATSSLCEETKAMVPGVRVLPALCVCTLNWCDLGFHVHISAHRLSDWSSTSNHGIQEEINWRPRRELQEKEDQDRNVRFVGQVSQYRNLQDLGAAWQFQLLHSNGEIWTWLFCFYHRKCFEQKDYRQDIISEHGSMDVYLVKKLGNKDCREIKHRLLCDVLLNL